ncbi:MAG: IS630 family transposase ISAcma34 [Saprospiraceae bacterium]|nr:IS630 family transposase ISAcma34 [Saprospiraceae bacterium]
MSEYVQGHQRLQHLLELAAGGHIELRFADETGFSRLPNIPYGWLPKGEQTGILADNQRVMNVFALMSLDHKLCAYPTKETISADFIIRALDDFCTTLQKPTVVVLDQAPWHRAARLQNRIPGWQQQDLFLFFLPRYSPHLNAIEILWRRIKYQWLKPADYRSAESLRQAIYHIFKHFGALFQINFSKNYEMLQ